MKLNLLSSLSLLLVAVGSVVTSSSSVWAAEILIGDRAKSAVHRYTVDGEYIATMIEDEDNINMLTAMQLSPDYRHLYVVSALNDQVTRYDYNYQQGTASNPVAFATAADGLMFPGGLLFSQDGNTIYVANLGGSGVIPFDLDGNVAGAPLMGSIGGTVPLFSGMAHSPTGDILVGGHQDVTTGTTGGVGRIDAGFTAISDFVAPETTLNGVATLLVDGNDLYVSAGYAGTVHKFDATTGAVDPDFTTISGLQFPAGLMLAPDGNGILVGDLGQAIGEGIILRYDFDGTLIGPFATTASGGFSEATAMILVNVPEPAALCMIAVLVLSMAVVFRRSV